MFRINHLLSSFAKQYVDIYTRTIVPSVFCIGIYCPDMIHKKEYTHLPLLFLFPVGYASFSLGRQMVENSKQKT